MPKVKAHLRGHTRYKFECDNCGYLQHLYTRGRLREAVRVCPNCGKKKWSLSSIRQCEGNAWSDLSEKELKDMPSFKEQEAELKKDNEEFNKHFVYCPYCGENTYHDFVGTGVSKTCKDCGRKP